MLQDIFSSTAIGLGGIFISGYASSYLKSKKSRGLQLYAWHTVFSGLYYIISLSQSSDAAGYYDFALSSDLSLGFGTDFIFSIVWILHNYVGFSYFNLFLFFNILGTIGLLAFDASLQKVVVNKAAWLKRLATVVVFLPSVSFWSAGIGKDAISFMAVGLALWAALRPNKRYGLMAFSIVAMLVVRPHIAGMMLLALVASLVLQRRVHLGKRLMLLGLSFAAAAVLVPFALNYAGLQGANNANDVEAYVQQRQGYNQEGGGGIDISSMSLPMQMATYVFRPLPFEANSITTAAAALDNAMILLVFLIGLNAWRKRRRGKRIDDGVNTTFLWLYSLATWVILGMTTANLGIAVRQKWMFVPVLVFLLLRMVPDKKHRHLRPAAPSNPALAPASRLPQT